MAKILRGDGKAFMIIFIGALIVITLLAGFSDDIYEQRNTRTYHNVTYTGPAVNSSIDLAGREFVSSDGVFINNGTATSCNSTSCVFSSGISASTGLMTVKLSIDDRGAGAGFAGASLNVSYIAEPDGYLNTSGARSIQGVVLIMSALAILVFIIVVLFKESSVGDLIRRR